MPRDEASDLSLAEFESFIKPKICFQGEDVFTIEEIIRFLGG